MEEGLMMKEKVMITSALPYVNYVPHFGHIVGCHLPGDIFHRFQRSIGKDAIFVGGSDDHGTASLVSAKEAGLTPKAFVEKMQKIHRKIYDKLLISYDLFSCTSSTTQTEVTQDIFRRLDKNGYIEERPAKMLFCEHDQIALADRFMTGICPKCGYDSAYGDQCDSCGATYDQSELKAPKCKFCGAAAVIKDTKHLYIKLDALSAELSNWMESKKEVWRAHVYGEAKKWVDEGLFPRAITRDISWGVEVPRSGYENKVFYVWFDAPIGYISITKELGELNRDKFGGGDQMVKDFWQNKDCKIYHFIGKDNISFHSVFFPCILLGSRNYQMAHNVVGFNFLNFEGGKFSKSKKTGVFCDALLNSDIDIDVVRAYLVTVFPENRDSDFKWDGFKNNTNSELVGKFGNFFNRTLNMIGKNFNGALDFNLYEYLGKDEKTVDEWIHNFTANNLLFDEDGNITGGESMVVGLLGFGKLSTDDMHIYHAIRWFPKQIADAFEKTEFRKAYNLIMAYARVGNWYLEKSAPWTLMKNENFADAKKILYLCLNLAKSLCIVASPIMPVKTKQVWQEQFCFAGDPTADDMWQYADKIDVAKAHVTGAPKPLYERIDDDRLAALKEEFSKTITMAEALKLSEE